MESIVNSKIIISDNTEDLSEQFALILLNGIKNIDGYFHLALSGGSTPKAVFNYLAKNYKRKIDWNRVKFFWGDERCVPSDHTDSNYKLAVDNLIAELEISINNIFRIHGEKIPEEEAINYSNVLLKNIPVENSLPRFDLIWLGLGEDGHTTSIFPNFLDLFETKSICAIAEHPVTLQKRITITGSVINNAAQIVFIASGESKSEVIDTILNKKEGFEKLPASYVNPKNGNLIWLIDKNAACLLK